MKTKDEREETRLIRDLKKQIIKLKKENASLRKRNNRAQNELAESELLLEENLINEFNQKKQELTDKKQSCPKCGAYEIILFQLRGLTYFRCEGCGAKGKFEENRNKS